MAYNESRFALNAIRKNNVEDYLSFLAAFNLPIVSIAEGLSEDFASMSHVRLRHDVDHFLENALAMAQIEYNVGAHATYFMLHPDGIYLQENYLGKIYRNHFVLSRKFIDIALKMQDMGHEIGLHNDLISFWIATGVPPEESLSELLDLLRKNGIRISGTASHGAALSRTYNFINYEIFSDCKRSKDTGSDDVIVNENHLKLHSINKSDYQLTYEAYFTNRDVYISDSHNTFYIADKQLEHNIDFQDEICSTILESMAKIPNNHSNVVVQALIHPDHWNYLYTVGFDFFDKASLEQYQEFFFEKKLNSKNYYLNNASNIIFTNIIEEKTSYNDGYNRKTFVFDQKPWHKYLDETAKLYSCRHPQNEKINIFELGCGQGDFLAYGCQTFNKMGYYVDGFGIDASYAGIVDAAIKYPNLSWITDNCVHFLDAYLENNDAFPKIPQKFDIIMDKTGMTHLDNFEDAYSTIKKVEQLLSEDGLYIYFASLNFYAKKYGDLSKWPLGWVEICKKIFKNQYKNLSNQKEVIAICFSKSAF